MSEIQRDQKIFKLASKSMLNDVFTVSISLSLEKCFCCEAISCKQ